MDAVVPDTQHTRLVICILNWKKSKKKKKQKHTPSMWCHFFTVSNLTSKFQHFPRHCIGVRHSSIMTTRRSEVWRSLRWHLQKLYDQQVKKYHNLDQCQFVGQSVGLSAGFHKNCWTGFHDTWMEDGSRHGIDPLKFLLRIQTNSYQWLNLKQYRAGEFWIRLDWI